MTALIGNRVRPDGANPTKAIGSGRVAREMAALVVVAVLLAGCGHDAGPSPTPTSRVQPGPQATKQHPPAATLPPTGMSVGILADQIAGAWRGVTSYRSTFTTGQSLGGAQAEIPGLRALAPVIPGSTGRATPKPSARVVVETTDEIALPDHKHRLITVNGQPVIELVAIGDQVYTRSYAPAASGLGAEPGAWQTIDRDKLGATTPMGGLVASLEQAGAAPLAQVAPTSRERPLTTAGPRTVGGRQCTVYNTVATTQTGERVDVSIAVDADHLPCLIQTSAGGLVGVTTFGAFNQPLRIAAPDPAPTTP